MDKRKFNELLDKYLQGNCSPEEKQEIEAWYMSFEGEKSFVDGLSQTEKEALEAGMLEKINTKIEAGNKPKAVPDPLPTKAARPVAPVRQLNRANYYLPRMAAAFIGLLLLAGLYYRLFMYQDIITFSTGYGQTASRTLPDGSVVTLNGNSTLNYPATWEDGQAREVSLQGEAFFTVVHTNSHQKFIVATNDQLHVEVLGTEFNVNTRKAGTRVVLSSGSVRLHLPIVHSASGKLDKGEEVLMKPGHLVEFSKEKNSYVKKEVDPKIYTSWKEEKLIFDNSTLQEIIGILEETYGLEVVVPDKSLLQERFTGAVPNESAEILLISLSKSFNLKITRTTSKVTILR